MVRQALLGALFDLFAEGEFFNSASTTSALPRANAPTRIGTIRFPSNILIPKITLLFLKAYSL